MSKKLCISLIFSILVATKLLNTNHFMHNLYTKFAKILEICKQFSHHLVNDKGNISRRGPV
ncbi:MAG: IS982 family transposase, partial [Prevotella sp.]